MDLKYILLLSPEIFLSALALLLLLGDAFFPRLNKTFLFISVGGLALSALYLVPVFILHRLPGVQAWGILPDPIKPAWVQYEPVLGMISVDYLSVFFKVVLIVAVMLVLLLSADYREYGDVPMGTYCALLLFGTVGLLLLVGAVDFLMAIIALELIGITSFILTGFIWKRPTATEGAIKFFLVGTFSTGLLLFGTSYYYGLFGSTHIEPLLAGPPGGTPTMMFSLVLIFLIAGLGFKLAMVPFHMWAPDAYEAAPTPVTAFLSVAPKVAAFGFLLRIFANVELLNLTAPLAALAALTMTVGNLAALHQTNVKRLMAYSSIAQVGYILAALVAGGGWGTGAVMLYCFIYVFMNLGVFALLILVSNQTQRDDIDTFAGFANKSMGWALALVVFLLSLTGVPPLAGFVGKFTIFASLIKTPSLVWLAVVAIINSVISLYYYFRIAQQAFFTEGGTSPAPLRFSPALLSALIVTLIVILVGGLIPGPIVRWVLAVVGS
ncbi:MAG: NADH-quinone oxidoreductase subunit N [Elusimicrobia bacterium]|nr:NADH-quinone oxidoreductase subunit N [Candidatus Obscuribacterium magneticum]